MMDRARLRECRRMAFIQFPRHSFDPKVIEAIAAEGYDDVGLLLIPDEGNMGNQIGQGFTLAQGRQLQDWCQGCGLAVTVFTGYMKYEEPLLAREPQRAMITFGGEGDQHDSDGLRSSWLCPFRPENLDRYFTQMLEPVTHWPALRELHLNDEAFLGFSTGAIGCYCDYCRGEYRRKFSQDPPTKADWQSPQWRQWIEYRFDQWTGVHAQLREQIKKLRPEVVVGIQHSPIAPLFAWNPWKTAIDLGRDARAMDLLATDPYHYMHLNVATIRPHRRLLAEGVRGLAGACLEDRAMTIYPQGFMPPNQSVPMGRGDGVLAGVAPFALGANTVSPYTYEMMKIIPGFDQTWQECRRLMPYFRRCRPEAFVTVIAPVQSEIYGHPQSDWGASYLVGLMDVMYRAGLSWRWFWDGRIEEAADQLRGPIIVPEAHCLNDAQLAVLRKVAQRGEGVLWIGNTAAGGWNGEFVPPAAVEEGEFELQAAGAEELFNDLPGAVMLQSRTAPPVDFAGKIEAKTGGRAGLLLKEEPSGRQAWLAGLPKFNCVAKEIHGVAGRKTGGIELLRRLLLWMALRPPVARLDPFPFNNDYAKLRPWDLRGVHNAELFPMVADDGILAIVLPYTPVGFETSVLFSPPAGKIKRVTELWSGQDWTGRLEGNRLPLHFDGGCELMAIWAELDLDKDRK